MVTGIREWKPVNYRSSNQHILKILCKQYPGNHIRLLILEKLNYICFWHDSSHSSEALTEEAAKIHQYGKELPQIYSTLLWRSYHCYVLLRLHADRYNNSTMLKKLLLPNGHYISFLLLQYHIRNIIVFETLVF